MQDTPGRAEEARHLAAARNPHCAHQEVQQHKLQARELRQLPHRVCPRFPAAPAWFVFVVLALFDVFAPKLSGFELRYAWRVSFLCLLQLSLTGFAHALCYCVYLLLKSACTLKSRGAVSVSARRLSTVS